MVMMIFKLWKQLEKEHLGLKNRNGKIFLI